MAPAKKKYIRLNHLGVTVHDALRSRDWYRKNLGLRVEFQVPAAGFVAMQDDAGFGFLISQGKPAKSAGVGVAIYFEVDDVDVRYRAMVKRRVKCVHPPQKTAWGYGPEVLDPDGYTLRLFDHRSITK